MSYDPASPPEVGLHGLRELRESGLLPPETSKTAEFQEAVITLLLDAGVLRLAMLNARGEWEAGLFGRHLALVLYEGLDDLAPLLHQAVTQLMHPSSKKADNARNRLRELSRSLQKLRNKYNADFRFIRNCASAHRDHDMRRFHEAVEAVSLDRFDVAFEEVLTWATAASTTAMALLFRHLEARPEVADQLEAHAQRIVGVMAVPSQSK